MNRAYEEALFLYLKHLLSEGSEGNVLTVSVGDIYLQFVFFPKDKWVHMEAVSNKFLPKDLWLSQDRVFKLKQIGFEEPEQEDPEALPNFYADATVTSDEDIRELAEKSIYALLEVYACPKEARPEFKLNESFSLGGPSPRVRELYGDIEEGG